MPKKPATPKPPPAADHTGEEVRGVLPLAQLKESPFNPRKTFPEDGLAELAASFAEHGILTPLLVRPIGKKGAEPAYTGTGWSNVDHFECVDGHRRLRAAKLAGVKQVPVTVRVLSDEAALVLMLIANDQREDVLPSEQAAAYAQLAATGKTAEQIAGATGRPLGAVRNLLRLAKLPKAALEAVDAGRLSRETAGLIARVPGEESRKTLAAVVMSGHRYWKQGDKKPTPQKGDEPLSSRDTKELIRSEFTRELKGAPFDRKSLTLLPDAGSCEACPDRAGNDPDAKAAGVRADTCLNPECYRAKCAAYRLDCEDDAKRKGIEPVPDEFAWPLSFADRITPPKGWCVLDQPTDQTELKADLTSATPEKLKALLGSDSPQQYLAFHSGKPVYLVKTTEARRALVAAGVLAKPEPRKRPERPAKVEAVEATALPEANGKPAAPPKKVEPTKWDIDERAASIAGQVLAEYAAGEFAALASVPDACEGGPVHDGLYYLARFLIIDHCQYGHERADAVRSAFGLDRDVLNHATVTAATEKADAMTAPALLAACLRMALQPSLDQRHESYQPLIDSLMGWAELDWEQLQEQAKSELTAELSPTPEPPPEPAANGTPIVKKTKTKAPARK